MLGTLAGEHVSTQGTLVLKYVSMKDTLPCEQGSKQGTFAPQHIFSLKETQFSILNKKQFR